MYTDRLARLVVAFTALALCSCTYNYCMPRMFHRNVQCRRRPDDLWRRLSLCRRELHFLCSGHIVYDQPLQERRHDFLFDWVGTVCTQGDGLGV